jgi:hypothetical protein
MGALACSVVALVFSQPPSLLGARHHFLSHFLSFHLYRVCSTTLSLSLSFSLSLFLSSCSTSRECFGGFFCLSPERARPLILTQAYAHTYTHTHIYIYTHVRSATHSLIHKHACTHTRTHTHTHTHIHVRAHNSLLFLTFLSSISRPSPASASQEPTTYEGDNYVLDTLGLSYLLGTFSDIALQKSRFSGLNVHVAHRVVQTVATDFVGNYLCEWAGLKPDRELLKASGNDEEFKVRTRVFGSPCVCLCLLDVRALSIS